MDNKETSFQSGESNIEVVRVGNTVRRALTKRSDFIHCVMKELTENGFELSPIFLGIDNKNREIISYISGIQMNRSKITLDLMKQSMSALRRFHDIFAVSDLRGDEETIIHTDFAPWNMIVERGKLVGVLDFDDARPGKRLTDVVYLCWTFLDIGDSKNKYSDEEVLTLIPELVEAYGELQIDSFVEELLREQKRILFKRRLRVKEANNREERIKRRDICKEIRKQISWVRSHRKDIEKVLKICNQ